MDAKELAILILAVVGLTFGITVKLRERDITYLAPEYDTNGVGSNFMYGLGLAEQVAVDEKRGLVYTVGNDQITVLTITPLRELKVIHAEKMAGHEFKMVQICKGYVTVTARNLLNHEDGRILVFRGYNKRSGSLEQIHSIFVGPQPTHHVHDRKCRRIIVAVEGEGEMSDGSIAIITFMRKRFQNPLTKTLTFTSFANRVDALEAQWFLLNPLATTFEQSIEPEWICMNKKETRAYVSLQENNGMAILDLTFGQERITELRGLGLKDWFINGTTEGLDPENSPKRAMLIKGNIFSAYMPGSISCQTIKKEDLVFLANEGREFPSTAGSTSSLSFMYADRDPNTDNLIILNALTLADRNMNGFLEKAIAIGARSFGVWRGGVLEVADTGSDLEQQTIELMDLFNANPTSDQTLAEAFDFFSVYNGPRPQSIVTYCACKGRYVVMIGGSANPGILSVYTLDTKNLQAGFEFQDLAHGYRDNSSRLNDLELYDNALLSLRGQGGLQVISGGKFGSRPMLIAAATISSTLNLYDIVINCH